VIVTLTPDDRHVCTPPKALLIYYSNEVATTNVVGANPTICSYNASAVKLFNATSSLPTYICGAFLKKTIFSSTYFKNALAYVLGSCKF
jgi:hypothetical protein